ncbi:MAG: hypothetical protein EZS28_002184 [Streblomastix strix]|uniref:Protein kinase domain-containing protein n=1 Tax=Streblomastix strix TaxID=222440 RepID=A0A5J4X4Y5_9EUKA|nr:MAG: hypothetical protein EZS28_002184 [Streblomastix strix]
MAVIADAQTNSLDQINFASDKHVASINECQILVVGKLGTDSRTYHVEVSGQGYFALRIIEPKDRYNQFESTLSSISHPNIVQLARLVETPTSIFLLHTFYDKGSLDLIIHNHPTRPIREDVVKIIIFNILQACAYIHSQGYMHGNITPEHILFKSIEGQNQHFNVALSNLKNSNTLNSPIESALGEEGKLFYAV